MEQKDQPQLKPLTQEQIEAEAAFAEKVYREFTNVNNIEKIREIIKRRRRSKAASLISNQRLDRREPSP